MNPVRVLVADDHPMFREGVRTMLGATEDLALVAEARDAVEALELLAGHAVDVALLDVNMPGMSGIEAAGRIAVDFPEVAVLILTMFADDASVFAALRAGARGYVLKDSERDDLLRAIRAVARGEAIFSPSVASRVLDFFAQRHPSVAPEDFSMLTSRERRAAPDRPRPLEPRHRCPTGALLQDHQQLCIRDLDETAGPQSRGGRGARTVTQIRLGLTCTALATATRGPHDLVPPGPVATRVS